MDLIDGIRLWIGLDGNEMMHLTDQPSASFVFLESSSSGWLRTWNEIIAVERRGGAGGDYERNGEVPLKY